jgi:hypothetical protein
MEQEPVDAERITIPRWTIKRDPRALGCTICGSAIVKITAEWRQVSFCTCRLIEYRVLPRAPQSASRSRPRQQTYEKNPNLVECLTTSDPCQACLRSRLRAWGRRDHF